jgi:hypothetical protein
VNGTAVPEGITFRSFSTNFHGYKFGRAGGWALQRVVTRLKNHGSMPSPPVQSSESPGPSTLILIFVEEMCAAFAVAP